MAISKVVYKENASATPVTWMDLTSDTVASSNLLSSYTAHGADGQAVSGAVGSGTEGTPTATKGTVSNHSVSVTPSVTNTAGVISGGTHTGTAVTVSASELVSGSETKTSNGTYDVTNLAQLVVNVSGGGGASNFVTGTFKGTTTGAAIDVTLNYSGSGWPIAVVIFPEGGRDGNATFSAAVQRYAIAYATLIKGNATTPCGYANGNDDEDRFVVMIYFKSSSSNSTSYASINQYTKANDVDATATQAYSVRIRSKTKMSVYIASTSYGFMANVDYRYNVIYSS